MNYLHVYKCIIKDDEFELSSSDEKIKKTFDDVLVSTMYDKGNGFIKISLNTNSEILTTEEKKKMDKSLYAQINLIKIFLDNELKIIVNKNKKNSNLLTNIYLDIVFEK